MNWQTPHWMDEYLIGERPPLNQTIWIGDLEDRPTAKACRKLQALVQQYGASHLTTAPSVRDGWIGIYLRGDVARQEPNFMRWYLSRP